MGSSPTRPTKNPGVLPIFSQGSGVQQHMDGKRFLNPYCNGLLQAAQSLKSFLCKCKYVERVTFRFVYPSNRLASKIITLALRIMDAAVSQRELGAKLARSIPDVATISTMNGCTSFSGEGATLCDERLFPRFTEPSSRPASVTVREVFDPDIRHCFSSASGTSRPGCLFACRVF